MLINGYKDLVNGDELAKRFIKIQETKKMADDYTYSFYKGENGI